jgi:hypothetical protein
MVEFDAGKLVADTGKTTTKKKEVTTSRTYRYTDTQRSSCHRPSQEKALGRHCSGKVPPQHHDDEQVSNV